MNNNLNKIIKYISYGSIVLVTFIMGIFIVSNKDGLKAGAVAGRGTEPVNSRGYICQEGAPKNVHTDSEVVTGYDIHAPHCHKGYWDTSGDDDDGGDGGSGYIDYQEFTN